MAVKRRTNTTPFGENYKGVSTENMTLDNEANMESQETSDENITTSGSEQKPGIASSKTQTEESVASQTEAQKDNKNESENKKDSEDSETGEDSEIGEDSETNNDTNPSRDKASKRISGKQKGKTKGREKTDKPYVSCSTTIKTELMEKLEKYRKETGCTLSFMVNKALTEYYEKYIKGKI